MLSKLVFRKVLHADWKAGTFMWVSENSSVVTAKVSCCKFWRDKNESLSHMYYSLSSCSGNWLWKWSHTPSVIWTTAAVSTGNWFDVMRSWIPAEKWAVEARYWVLIFAFVNWCISVVVSVLCWRSWQTLPFLLKHIKWQYQHDTWSIQTAFINWVIVLFILIFAVLCHWCIVILESCNSKMPGKASYFN